jgi:protein-disulfide isomerase
MKLHPSTRLVFAVGAIAMLLGVCVAQLAGAAKRTAATETLRAITKVMYRMYQGGESKIPLRADDPHRGADGEMAQITAVVFGDFSCGSCRRLAARLEQDVVPLFDNHFRIVFKHYPICSHCNPEVAGRQDPACCEAAQLAEAARAQGGNDAFWKAHDALFELAGQGKLSQIQHRELARTLDLDPDRLVADMSSEAVARRIQEDIKLARSLGVRTVPAVFVCDRAIPEVAVMQMKFWEAVAHVHKAKLSQQG